MEAMPAAANSGAELKFPIRIELWYPNTLHEAAARVSTPDLQR